MLERDMNRGYSKRNFQFITSIYSGIKYMDIYTNGDLSNLLYFKSHLL